MGATKDKKDIKQVSLKQNVSVRYVLENIWKYRLRIRILTEIILTFLYIQVLFILFDTLPEKHINGITVWIIFYEKIWCKALSKYQLFNYMFLLEIYLHALTDSDRIIVSSIIYNWLIIFTLEYFLLSLIWHTDSSAKNLTVNPLTY